MVADSPDLAAAMGLLDLAKERGFRFWRTGPGEDSPLFGERESRKWIDTILLAGFSDSCNAARIRKSPLTVPNGSVVTERVTGDAIEVLHIVCDWDP